MSLKKNKMNQSAMAAPKQVSAFAAFKARAKEALGMQTSEVEAVQTLSISKLVDNHDANSAANTLDITMSRSKSERRKLTKAEKRQRRMSLPDTQPLRDQLPLTNGSHKHKPAETSDNDVQIVSGDSADEVVMIPDEGHHGKKRRHSNIQQESKKPRKDVTHKTSSSSVSIPTLMMFDSVEEGNRVFEWLIGPVQRAKFFSELWEKKPLLVRRHQPDYYKGVFSTREFDAILKKEDLQYTVNLDVTRYVDGKRETLNPEGKAYAPVVWDFYNQGCSIRLLNPQTYSKYIWKLDSVLQDCFGTFVGSNVYLTPPNTQGFAPHWDDIEAFVLQLEGKKHWKVYNPRCEEETLPRTSSRNFTEEEVGKPVLDAILEPGDLLYMPRGFIHQAFAQDDLHSLHITVSSTQKNTWGDLFEKLLPQALELAIQEDVELRKALPTDYLSYMGLAMSEVKDERRDAFMAKAKSLFDRVWQHALVDGAADQVAKGFMHEALPPYFTENEKACSIHGNGESMNEGKVVLFEELNEDHKVKLIRKNCLRLTMEGEGDLIVYHTIENSRVYKEKEQQNFDVPVEWSVGIEHLIQSYPEYVKVSSLPLENSELQLELCNLLYDKGLLITDEPLKPLP